MIVQAVLLGIVAFVAQSEYVLGTSLLFRPVVTGLFTRIVLDDVRTGIIMGVTLKLALIGSFSVGASIPPDIVTGGILETAFAVTAGAGTGTTLLLGLPIAMLTSILKNIYLGSLIPVMNHKADNYAKEGNYRGVEHMHLLAGIGLPLTLGIVVMVSYIVGSNTIGNLLNMTPDFVQKGLLVATGLTPTLGSAMFIRLLISKQVAPYFFLDFAIVSYLEIPVTGVAIFGAILVVVVVSIMNVRQLPLQTITGEVEEDEEF